MRSHYLRRVAVEIADGHEPSLSLSAEYTYEAIIEICFSSIREGQCQDSLTSIQFMDKEVGATREEFGLPTTGWRDHKERSLR